MDQAIRVVRVALLAVVVVSEVFLKVGNIYDFAFFEVCVVHGRGKGFGV